ncbi:MAG TPA: DUF433 domain-containing protein [Chloroflexota bacterium]|jgi:uncharacterized protein (DUF433 family)
MALPQPVQFPHVVRDPRILGGEPTVKGTRVPVRAIVLFLRYNGDLAHIFEAFPRLTQTDVDQALAFYQANQAEIERHIRENEDDAQ